VEKGHRAKRTSTIEAPSVNSRKEYARKSTGGRLKAGRTWKQNWGDNDSEDSTNMKGVSVAWHKGEQRRGDGSKKRGGERLNDELFPVVGGNTTTP